MGNAPQTLRDGSNRPGIRTGLIAGVVMYALSRGVSMERITEATGVRSTDLVDPHGWLPQRIMPTLWLLLAQVCPGESVGVSMAQAAPLSIFGPLLHLSRHAESGRAGMELLIRYHSIMSDGLSLRLLEEERQATLRVAHPMDAIDGGHAVEMGIAMAARVLREVVCQQSGLMRVEFGHAPFGPVAQYESFFAAPVHFECAYNALIFDASLLDEPPPDASPEMCRFIESQLRVVRERLMTIEGPDDLTAVRTVIARNAERAEFGAEALARKLGMSLRKLQRITRTHGTTVRALLEEAREAHARQLLRDKRLSVEQVAFLLGYAEDRAFRRAFKRWTGQTPAQLRG